MINTAYLSRLLKTMLVAVDRLGQTHPDELDYELYRHAVVKEFELLLEMCGKLLRKALKTYNGSPKMVDELFYNDVFRQCSKHGLFDVELVERWFVYRANRNQTAHDYGADFIEKTLVLLPSFMKDVQTIIDVLDDKFA
jgi:uncharacterized protein YutE (UPF0331/DUF86 family)